jgi:hypothetical protein
MYVRMISVKTLKLIPNLAGDVMLAESIGIANVKPRYMNPMALNIYGENLEQFRLQNNSKGYGG